MHSMNLLQLQELQERFVHQHKVTPQKFRESLNAELIAAARRVCRSKSPYDLDYAERCRMYEYAIKSLEERGRYA